jgi:poly(hydroxyalkanoate) granule-associated protein
MARTKRTPRTTRKAPRTLERIKALAIARARALARQGTMITLQGRKLALAKARQARAALNDGALVAKSRATQAVGRFERVFEDRVGRAIGKLGVPTARDVRTLSRQVAHLQQSVNQLRRSRARA